MYQKALLDDPKNWQPIEESQLKKELKHYYGDIDEILFQMWNGGIARTLFAQYRYVRQS